MAITNPFSITFGGRTVGGSTAYQLLGPYVLDKSHSELRVVFDVIIAGTSHSDLQSKSDTLETDFARRLTHGQTLVITLGSSSWTYSVGTTALRVAAQIVKSGNSETDRGYSRAYTVTVTAELPATADAGLRDVEVLVERSSSRQRTVTMRGTYTAGTAGDAAARYENDFDTEASSYLDAIDAGATWELVQESYSLDRERDSGGDPYPHLCQFTRQYTELIANQTLSQLDDTQIRDHRVTFTDTSQHPGDAQEDKYRLRRVIASYDCSVDIDETTDLDSVYRNSVMPHLKGLFEQNFQPQVFGVQDQRVGFDYTANRISISATFLYQKAGGDAVVEVTQSVAFREQRNIDYTPTHDQDEFAYEADVGFAVLERIWNRLAIVVGNETPKLRIIETPRSGSAGLWTGDLAGQQGVDTNPTTTIRAEGWNIVSSTSQVSPAWIGDPEYGQIQVMTLSETVVEKYHRRPGTRTSVPIQRGPVT